MNAVSITPLPPVILSGWRSQAACRGMDIAVFFGYGNSAVKARQARQVCEWCPVRAECLAENINVPYGMWGGLTEVERRKLRRTRPRRELYLRQKEEEAAS